MLIGTDKLISLLNQPDILILDCRFYLDQVEKGRQLYLESHIPGAIYADLNKDLSAAVIPGKTGRHPLPEVTVFQTRLESWGLTPRHQVIAYDDAGGVYAARLWWLLKWVGHHNVHILNGGWNAWAQAGLAVSKDIPNPVQSQYSVSPNPEMVVTADDIMQACENNGRYNDSGLVLVDARALPRFLGEVEPIDPVAGHIPKALCHPFQINLSDTGRFKSSETLLNQFQNSLSRSLGSSASLESSDISDTETATGGNNLLTDQKIVHYCGSGVTACHNLFAMQLAGYPMPLLYPGSWSEWITNPARPIATGEG